MPQDSLWAASARSIGLRITFMTAEATLREHGSLMIQPVWSKTPSGRDGTVWLNIPTYATWEVPSLIHHGFDQWNGGDPKHVPSVVRSRLQHVLHEYQEGARS